MNRFRFLLLDAGPIIKLFELGLWDSFIGRHEVAVTPAVTEEAQFAFKNKFKLAIDLSIYIEDKRISLFDVNLPAIHTFLSRFKQPYRDILDPGETEILTLLCGSAEE